MFGDELGFTMITGHVRRLFLMQEKEAIPNARDVVLVQPDWKSLI